MRCIICSQGRTGSNFLRLMLRQHSELRVGGELCNPGVIEKYHNSFFSDPPLFDPHMLALNIEPWIEYIWAHFDVWNCHDSETVGVFDTIAKDASVKVVFLSREDSFAQAASHFMAVHHDLWLLQNGKERPEMEAIDLDAAKVIQCIKLNRHARAKVTEQLSNHESIDVTYEQLVDETEKTVSRITDFIGVSRQLLQPGTKKILPRPLPEYITNYDEVLDAVKKAGLL